MKILNNSGGSLPDVASLSLEIPRSPVDLEESVMKSPQSNNNMKFFVPSALPPRRNLNTGKQVFPRQFSNPESKDIKEQRYLVNQVGPDLQGNSIHSPTSPVGSIPPPFGTISPLAYEAMFSPSLLPSPGSGTFEQEQYLNLLRMNDLMSDPMGKQLQHFDDQQQQQQHQQQQQQQPSQQQLNMMVGNNMHAKMMQNRQANVNQINDDFANQFRMGITGHHEQRDDISDEILNNIRVGLDPLNFEDYQLLANSNLEVADHAVEEQFRQDRINFQ